MCITHRCNNLLKYIIVKQVFKFYFCSILRSFAQCATGFRYYGLFILSIALVLYAGVMRVCRWRMLAACILLAPLALYAALTFPGHSRSNHGTEGSSKKIKTRYLFIYQIIFHSLGYISVDYLARHFNF